MNVVLADRTRQSTRLDSRNGLGKSTLIEIIHFCLGANVDKKSALASPLLGDWIFSLDFDLGDQRVVASRSLLNPGEVTVSVADSSWSVQPTSSDVFGNFGYSVSAWISLLGVLLLGLDPPAAASSTGKYQPAFRGLISYFIRRGRGAFLSPFAIHPKQLEWNRQVSNSFLLGLDWEDARDWQRLKDKQREIDSFEKATATGFAKGFFGSLGELEAAKVRLEGTLREYAAALASFQVHPQYRDIERRANELTQNIHRLTNENVVDRQLLENYEAAIRDEQEPGVEDVAAMYREAGVVLSTTVQRRLSEVQEFHNQVVRNRRAFLAEEIDRLRRMIEDRSATVERLSADRASRLEVLRTHGALEEHVRLQEQHTSLVQQLRETNARIEAIRRLQRERAELRIELETLRHRAQLNYDERRAQRDRAIALFNANSEALYNAPGSLVIDVTPNGFRFDVEIERSKSQGIENMKVFCYDLALAELWASYDHTPGVLIHDSTIFDGVDERQVARALELAAARSRAAGFQYICTMNSDTVPWDEFSSGFSLNEHVRLRLTDTEVAGSLLGSRF